MSTNFIIYLSLSVFSLSLILIGILIWIKKRKKKELVPPFSVSKNEKRFKVKLIETNGPFAFYEIDDFQNEKKYLVGKIDSFHGGYLVHLGMADL